VKSFCNYSFRSNCLVCICCWLSCQTVIQLGWGRISESVCFKQGKAYHT